MKRAVVIAVGFLAGCTTVEQEANKTALLNSTYVGRPLSDFMLKNGATPDNYFNLTGQRVFIFSTSCNSWWYTKSAGPSGTPESWIVERVEIRGYCP
ncbi:hypothetical protein [Mesorhizobium sp. 10J20-29]